MKICSHRTGPLGRLRSRGIRLSALVCGLYCLVMVRPAPALEIEDLAGFWRGSIEEVDESGNVTGKLPATLDVIQRGDAYDFYLGATVYFSRLKNVKVIDDTLEFDWLVGPRTHSIKATVENGSRIRFENKPSDVDPILRFSMSKVNDSRELSEEVVSGTYRGRTEAGTGHANTRKDWEMDVTLDLEIKGDQIRAKFKGEFVQSPLGKVTRRNRDISFERLERHRNRLFFFQKSDQATTDIPGGCMIAWLKPGSMEVTFIFPELGNGVGTLTRAPDTE